LQALSLLTAVCVELTSIALLSSPQRRAAVVDARLNGLEVRVYAQSGSVQTSLSFALSCRASESTPGVLAVFETGVERS